MSEAGYSECSLQSEHVLPYRQVLTKTEALSAKQQVPFKLGFLVLKKGYDEYNSIIFKTLEILKLFLVFISWSANLQTTVGQVFIIFKTGYKNYNCILFWPLGDS